MSKVETKLTDGQTGNIVALKENATDDTGEYLRWMKKEVDDGYTKLDYWEALGNDGKTYTIKESPPVKTGTVKIATGTTEPPIPPKGS